jgi:hypothetical protein
MDDHLFRLFYTHASHAFTHFSPHCIQEEEGEKRGGASHSSEEEGEEETKVSVRVSEDVLLLVLKKLSGRDNRKRATTTQTTRCLMRWIPMLSFTQLSFLRLFSFSRLQASVIANAGNAQAPVEPEV